MAQWVDICWSQLRAICPGYLPYPGFFTVTITSDHGLRLSTLFESLRYIFIYNLIALLIGNISPLFTQE